MSTRQISLPPEEFLQFIDKDGNVWLEDSAIEFDLLVGQAQAGLDPDDYTFTDLWLERYRNLLQAKYEIEITRQQAFGIYGACCEAMDDLKKTLPGLAPSQSSTESTPSASSDTKPES